MIATLVSSCESDAADTTDPENSNETSNPITDTTGSAAKPKHRNRARRQTCSCTYAVRISNPRGAATANILEAAAVDIPNNVNLIIETGGAMPGKSKRLIRLITALDS
jgi:hypothetical protein